MCNEEFEMYELNHYITCSACLDYHTRNPERKEIYEKLIKEKIRLLKKYRRENLRNATFAGKQAELFICRALGSFGMKVEKERIFFPYIADFHIKNIHYVVEIDGSVHDKQIGYDDRRDEWLTKKYNLTVLRFKNSDVGLDIFRDSIWSLGDKFLKEQVDQINSVAQEVGIPKYRLS
ncbi:DUF559 domain-containing protein [Candidatus Pacearchaeota archaeon]|nr:DUF559 domain-containing protein [Candidatus Pacearchaeota archaeon]